MKKYFFILCLIVGICVVFGADIGLGAGTTTTYELQITFTSNPMIVSPGTNTYIEVIFENTGSETVCIYDIDASSWDSSVVKPRGNWNVEIGNLHNGGSLSVLYEFYVPNTATPGFYQVVFDISSTVGDARRTAMIKVEDSTVLDITSVKPSSINIGELSTLTINISNDGSTPVYNIEFSWDDNNDFILPIGADNKIKIDEILGNNYTEVSFDVMVNPSCPAGVYPLLFSLEFYDGTGSQETITSEVGIQIEGGTDFELVLQSSNSATTFAIANTGANTASSVIVSIPFQPGYSTTGASSVSLGSLDAGDYTLATFQVSQTSSNTTQRPNFDRGSMQDDFDSSKMQGMMRNFSGGSNFVIEISYTDLFGIRQTVEKEVLGTSLSSLGGATDIASRFSVMRNGEGMPGGESSGFDSGTIYVIIGIVGIILIVTILKVGKSKKILNKLKGKKE